MLRLRISQASLLSTCLGLGLLIGPELAPLKAMFAVAFVTSTSAGATSASTATSGSVTTTGATLFVANLSCFAQTPATGFSDSKGNSWSYLTVVDDSGGGGMESGFAYAWSSLSVGSGHTFSYNCGSFSGFTLLAFSGTDTSSNPFDQQAGAVVASATTAQPGSITPSTAGQVVVTGVVQLFSSDDTWSMSGTYSAPVELFYNGNVNNGVSYDIQTAATATNPLWTSVDSVRRLAKVASFKASSGGAAAPCLLRVLGVGCL